MTRHARARLLLSGSLWFLGACGNLTAGGFGEAEVHMTGDADGGASPSASRSDAHSPATAPPMGVVVIGTLVGTVEAEVALDLLGGGGSVVPLTPAGPVRAEVDLAGTEEAGLALEAVPAGTYGALRVRVTSVEAEVLGGLLVDDVPFLGPVTVLLPSGGLAVTLPLDIEVSEGERVRLLVDLDSDAWLATLDPLTGTVAGSALLAEIGALVR